VNKSYCNSCRKLVPSKATERDGQVFLVKSCPDCGQTETIISTSAERYNAKHALDMGYDYAGCELNCAECAHRGGAHFAFVDVTNRCNMQCPICCDDVPSMGFRFDPPMEYFDKVFQQLAAKNPIPIAVFFGGEPTVRNDLFDIVELGRSYGITTRVITNGLRMANKDYCQKILNTRATILMSYDGTNPELYKELRGGDRYRDIKERAIRNIASTPRLKRGRVEFITCIARGLNDDKLPEYLAFCHRNRHWLRRVNLMPLAHTWEGAGGGDDPERITTEDVEQLVADCFPGEKVEFLPAGFVAEFRTVLKYLRSGAPPFLGAHPNCESMYILMSDGEKYVPLSHYLEHSIVEFGQALLDLERRLKAREKRSGKGLFGGLLRMLHLDKALLKFRGLWSISYVFVRQLRLGRMVKGRGLAKLWHSIALTCGLLFRRHSRTLRAKHTNMQHDLQIVILPFEDDFTTETDRFERCPNLHVYLDPETDELRSVPVCAWRLHNVELLGKVADRYPSIPLGKVAAEEEPQTQAADVGAGAE
jgi:uncharacterized radical SAM superfamily Fe-S cluster-containing enzyme